MTTHIPSINHDELSALFDEHERVLVMFSGGKDSLALVHLLEPYKDRFELVWVNTGAMFPHMESFVRDYGNRYRLVELKSDQEKRFDLAGLPAYVVPISYTPLGIAHVHEGGPKVKINDWLTCCQVLRTQPAVDYAKSVGATLILHGQRFADKGGLPLYFTDGEIEALGPIYYWTTPQVMGYIEEHGIELPEQYSFAGVSLSEFTDDKISSLECWNCTASLSVSRINYMRERYPELLEQLKPSIKAVYGAVMQELERSWPAVINAMDGERI